MAGVTKTQFSRGILLRPDDVAVEGISGELKVTLTTQKFQVYLDSAIREIITADQAQTLTNKTINVDNNTVSNIEVDNLKSGVLNTSTTLAGATDTQIPSALAVKTYVDDTAAAGDAALQAHINDSTDAHDASSISNVPAGTIAATDVQTAINELDGDIQAHITDSVGAHAASAISNTPAGTIAATDVQAAITELDSDIQGHINDTTSAHQAIAIEVDDVGFSHIQGTDVQDMMESIDNEFIDVYTAIDAKVTGPVSATNDAIARFDGTTGEVLDNSLVTISDAGVVSGATQLNVDNLRLDGNTISATNGGNVVVTPGASAYVDMNGNTIHAQDKYIAFVHSDNNTSGANATLTINGKTTRLINSGLTSIDMIVSDAFGKEVILINRTGAAVTINNDTGATAAYRILTGTGSPLTLDNNASITLVFDGTTQRWNVVGGSGAGGGAGLENIFQLTGTDVALWSTGDNATFLGGGTLSGTFAANTSTPLHGIASYVYTQAAGSLNDYLASPAKTVDPRFRGVPVTLYFPYTYDGATNDIEVIIYDATNNAIIPNSAFIQVTSGITIFKTNVTIPLTCTSIRMGFHVKVLNSTKILAFDDVQLSSDTTIYADTIDTQSTFISQTASFSNAAITGTLTTQNGSGIISYNSSTGVYTALKRTKVTMSVSLRNTGAASANALILLNGVTTVASSFTKDTTGVFSSTSYTGILEAGNTLQARNGNANASDQQIISLSAIANTDNIVTAPDTFSTDTATLTYAGSSTYTLATLANAPVGTFITFTYAINTNTRTQTNAAPPTQTTSDMNQNGIILTPRAYNQASTSGTPSTFAIQIGKGLKGRNLDLYKTTGKVTAGSIDWGVLTNDTVGYGIRIKDYNELTGVLLIDAGLTPTTTQTSATFVFSDATIGAPGYLVINASKNPALTGLNISAVAARGVNTAGTIISNAGSTVLVYDSAKTYDTHGALNTSTGIFTCPETGYYQINGAIFFASVAYAVSNPIIVDIQKNGSTISRGMYEDARAATYFVGSSCGDTIFMVKGDTCNLLVTNQRTAGSTALTSGVGFNFFSICKVSIG